MQWRNLLGLVTLAAVLVTTTIGCANNVSEASVAQSSVPRNTTPVVSEEEVAVLAKDNTSFAFDLYQAVRGQSGNLFYSPHSITAALAMTYAGSRGQTETQMAQTLHYSLPQNRLHAAFNTLDLQLANRGSGAKGQDDQGFRLKIANSVWGQVGYAFVPEYLDVLAGDYGAGLRLTDFQQSPEPARATINDWVQDNTEGKIKDLLPPGSITSLTRLVLANAVYFNAAWKYSFDKNSTHQDEFTLLDGSQVSAPLMSQLERFNYAQGAGYQAVELVYDGNDTAMVIVLPDEGPFDQFEQSLNGAWVNAVVQSLEPRQVRLTIPKLAYGSSLSLAKTLEAMGMGDAVTPGKADFTGISTNPDLYISDVLHKAIIAVDEKGTEAAAATAVIVGLTALPEVDVEMTVDHPFVFFIRDVKTGTVLFVGRVVNPVE